MYNPPPASDLRRFEANMPAPGERRANWWLRLTSVPPSGDTSFDGRERVRRSRLASWLILGMMVFDLLLIPLSIGSNGTVIAIVSAFVGLIIAALCNRLGWVTFSAFFLVIVITAAVFGSIVSEPNGLTMFDLPGYDILVVTVVIAASILPAISAFFVAFINAGLVVLDFNLQPHAPDVLTNTQLYGTVGLLARPIALLFIVAIVGYLWVRGTHREVMRADRAEQMATLEHAYAEQRHQLEVGAQQILATHVRIANGDFSARAPLTQDNVLWQISASLNNLLGRLQKAGQSDYRLQRTDEEIDRVVAALRDLQAGRHAIWPAPSGTSADKLLAMLAPPRLRQGGAASQPGPLPGWDPSGAVGGQQWQLGSGGGTSGPGGPSGPGGAGQASWMSGVPPFPGQSRVSEQGRGWSPSPEWFDGVSDNSLPPTGPLGQMPLGQQAPSRPPQQQPRQQQQPQPRQQDNPSVPLQDQFWPSLDALPSDGQRGSGRGAGGAQPGQENSFPPLDNPWYLPPDE